MANLAYTALRSLRFGVIANDSIDFDFDVSAVDRMVRPVGSSGMSKSGVEEVMKDRKDEFYNIVTIPVLADDFDHFRQFLDSVDDGEQFTIDPYGTSATPVLPFVAVLSSKGYTERRVSQRYLSVSFKVRKL